MEFSKIRLKYKKIIKFVIWFVDYLLPAIFKRDRRNSNGVVLNFHFHLNLHQHKYLKFPSLNWIHNRFLCQKLQNFVKFKRNNTNWQSVIVVDESCITVMSWRKHIVSLLSIAFKVGDCFPSKSHLSKPCQIQN